MNKYQKLYNQVLELENKTKSEMEALDMAMIDFNKNINDCDCEIEEIKREIKLKNNIYATVVNYKDFIKKKIKSHIKGGLAISGVFGTLMLIAGLLTSLVSKTFLWQDILFALGVSGVLGVALAVSNFIEVTKDSRLINKEYKDKIYAFPVMIASMNHRLEIEQEIKVDFETKLNSLNIRKEELNNELKNYSNIIYYLLSKITNECQLCRNDEEVINEVYAFDDKVLEVEKLIRSKRKKQITS